MLVKKGILLLTFLLCVDIRVSTSEVEGTEYIKYSVCGKLPLHIVSDKFISLSIDPRTLLDGINITESSLILAESLAPFYLRIAGPSTKRLHFSGNEGYFTNDVNDESAKLNFTSPMLGDVINWLSMADLTPVFAINNMETENGPWNPEPWLPLMESVAKEGTECVWQLGFGCSKKSVDGYKNDLSALRNVVNKYSPSNDSWKIVSADLSTCVSPDKKIDTDLITPVDAVMWEPTIKCPEKFPQSPDVLVKDQKIEKEIWTTAPMYDKPIEYNCALGWARKIGEAARMGYSVVFRQPQRGELFADTHIYWVSLLHKVLMGQNVLNVTALSESAPNDVFVYAHCTRRQNRYPNATVTYMVVNNSTKMKHIALKVKTSEEKQIHVDSYQLTAPDSSSDHMNFNGNKLSMASFTKDLGFIPETILLAPTSDGCIKLPTPPKSVTFYVVKCIEVPACDDKKVVVYVTDDNKMETVATKKRKRYVSAEKHKKLIKILQSRIKRSINMDLLKMKTKGFQPQIKEERHIREPDEYHENIYDSRPIVVQPGYPRTRHLPSVHHKSTSQITNSGRAHEEPEPQHHRPRVHPLPRHRFRLAHPKEEAAENSKEGLRQAMQFLAEGNGEVHSRSGAGKHHFIKNNAEPKFQLGKGYVSKGKAFTEADDMRETNDYSPHYNELYEEPFIGSSAEIFRDYVDDYYMDNDYNNFDYNDRHPRHSSDKSGKLFTPTKPRKTRDVSSPYALLDQLGRTDRRGPIGNEGFIRLRERVQNRRLQMIRRLQNHQGALRNARQKRSPMEKTNFVEYVSQTKNIKEWTPMDILQLSKLKRMKAAHKLLMSNSIPKMSDDVLIYKNVAKRDVNSIESTVDASLNEIDANIRPVVTLPNGNKLEVIKTEINADNDFKIAPTSTLSPVPQTDKTPYFNNEAVSTSESTTVKLTTTAPITPRTIPLFEDSVGDNTRYAATLNTRVVIPTSEEEIDSNSKNTATGNAEGNVFHCDTDWFEKIVSTLKSLLVEVKKKIDTLMV